MSGGYLTDEETAPAVCVCGHALPHDSKGRCWAEACDCEHDHDHFCNHCNALLSFVPEVQGDHLCPDCIWTEVDALRAQLAEAVALLKKYCDSPEYRSATSPCCGMYWSSESTQPHAADCEVAAFLKARGAGR
jgi:hypothetical protein